VASAGRSRKQLSMRDIASSRQPATQIISATSPAGLARVCGISRSMSGTKRRPSALSTRRWKPSVVSTCSSIMLATAMYRQLKIRRWPSSAHRSRPIFGVIMTKAALPYFRGRASGHIIQISSIGGRVGPAGRAAYAAAKFGVEGFSESLAKEAGPLGVKVTIVEPGGFLTDFAGSSTELREGRAEYDATVGATVRFQRNCDGKQPGDPAKAATAVLHIASLSDPPLRLLLGSHAYSASEKHALEMLESDRKWKELSVSTDDKSAVIQ